MSAGDRDDEQTDRGEPVDRPPGDDDAWAAIVANYGERATLDPEPPEAAGPPDPVEPTDLRSPEPAPVERPETIEVEDRYVPPVPPPAPRPRGPRGLAWCGVLGAPLLLLLVAVTDLGPTWVPVVLAAWFVVGFGYLVATMPRGPRDPWDDGAQV